LRIKEQGTHLTLHEHDDDDDDDDELYSILHYQSWNYIHCSNKEFQLDVDSSSERLYCVTQY